MIVYVIEQGIYSDRKVIGVTETEEKAKQICNGLNRYSFDSSANYSAYDTEQFQTQKIRYTVVFTLDNEPEVSVDRFGIFDQYDHSVMVYPEFFVIYTDTPEQAVKIAYDMRAEAEAERNGLC